jgi:hypothetical protein
VPRHQIGTISSSDGRFEISLPRDTLVFFHVSYQEAAYPVTGPADDVLIVLREQELPPAVSIGIAPQVVMKFTGHADYKSTKPCIDIAEKAKTDAMDAMDKALGEK